VCVHRGVFFFPYFTSSTSAPFLNFMGFPCFLLFTLIQCVRIDGCYFPPNSPAHFFFNIMGALGILQLTLDCVHIQTGAFFTTSPALLYKSPFNVCTHRRIFSIPYFTQRAFSQHHKSTLHPNDTAHPSMCVRTDRFSLSPTSSSAPFLNIIRAPCILLTRLTLQCVCAQTGAPSIC